MQRFALIATLVAIPLLNVAAAAQPGKPKTLDKVETCESIKALATGFGQQKVSGFASGNLDLAIDQAKNRLAEKGAKGFRVMKRSVACEDYIDFGGSIGREHLCTATAQVCGKG
jgi:hypothetical protein